MAALASTPHTTITALLQTISTALSSGSSDAANDTINDLLQELVQIRKEFPAKSEQRNEFTRSLLSSITTSVTPVQEENKIDVAWDLDDCLIRSLRIKGLEPDQSLNTTITERISDNEILHVDDDQIRFRTTLRSFAPLILGILQPFCRQHVFTSASRGYMINVVSLVENFFDQPKPLFQSKRLSCTDFPKYALVSGKDISKLEIPSHSRGSLLIDDNARYHLSQPRRGLLIPKFPSIDEQDDPSLFGIAVGILQAAAAAAAAATGGGGGGAESIERVCISCNPPEYWDDMVIARAFSLSRECVEQVGAMVDACVVLAEDTWGSEMIGDDIWNKAVLRVGMKRRQQRFDSGVEYWMKKMSKATSKATAVLPPFLLWSRCYWGERGLSGCDAPPPADATVSLTHLRSVVDDCLGFWPCAPHPNVDQIVPYEYDPKVYTPEVHPSLLGTKKEEGAPDSVLVQLNKQEFDLWCEQARKEETAASPTTSPQILYGGSLEDFRTMVLAAWNAGRELDGLMMFTPSEDFQYELQQFRIDWNSSQVLIGGYIAWDGFGMKRFIKHLKDS